MKIAYESGLRAARNACVAELLDDPEEAHDQAVRGCVSAIERLMRHQV